MKKTLLTTVLACATVCAFAQGTIQFTARATGTVVAHVYGPEPGNATNRLTGNTTAETPAGTQTYTGALLAGSGFSAELWAGSNGTVEGSLAAVAGSLSTFRTGGFAGFWFPPAGGIPIPGVLEGGIATLQVRVWDNAGGTITSWAGASSGNLAKGVSALFQSTPLGGLSAPPVLDNMRSFNLQSTVPEPSTFVLAGLGAAGLLIFRRRK